MGRQCQYKRGGAGGFSLIELLAVIAIMAVLVAMLVPSIYGWGSTIGRRGAVTLLMNTFEQARVAAIESGQTVYVGFADKDFPVEDMRYAAFLVFREATEEEKSASGGTQKYVVLKKWTRLPKNISLKSNIVASIFGAGENTFPGLNAELPKPLQHDAFPSVTFNSSGSVDQPIKDKLKLYVYEGYFTAGQDNYTRNSDGQSSASALFEVISISRFTGRVQLDVSTLQ